MNENEALTLKAKADLQLSTLTTPGGGELIADQARQFFLVAIERTGFTRRTNLQTMAGPKAKIPRMTYTGRVMHAASESTPLPAAHRSAPTMDEVNLSSKLGRGEVQMSKEVLEDNVQRNQLRNIVVNFVARKVGVDIEDLGINGNTSTGADDWLLLINGILAQTTTNTFAGGTARLTRELLRFLYLTLPDEYSSADSLRFLTSRRAVSDYHADVADRPGNLGDMVFEGNRPALGFEKIPVEWLQKFPTTLGTGNNETNVWLGNPKNWITAFQRQVELETEYSVRAQQFIFVVSLRMDQVYEYEPAAAKMTGILSA